ncbi:MAG: hypothetical protein LPK85_07610 [Gammaproteobacteria bacterium]|nr:hypothetical protein [Gammaproteobacteria bacterium]
MPLQPLSPAEELHSAVALSEQIKQIVNHCHGINLMGINAILHTKRAGAGASGFGVVSSEIRALSARLQRDLMHFGTQSQALIDCASQLLKINRRQRLVALGCTLCAQPDSALHITLAQLDAQYQAIRARLDGLHAELYRQAHDAHTHGRVGAVLARAATIESAHAQGAHQVLREVSARFEQQIERMLEGVESLQRILAH